MKEMKNVIIACSLVFIASACNQDKNDETGPVYRGQKGVVIRGTNEDDRLQMGGFADSLNSDSLMRVKKQGNMPNPGNEKREEINNGSDNR